MIIVYEIPSRTDWIFCHFGSFFALLPAWQPEKSKYKKSRKKKTPGDIIILYNFTKNHDHMLYCSWDMVRDRCNCYFSFWAFSCSFTTLTAQKIKISKKWKNTWRYYHFTYVYQKLWSNDVWFLRYVRDGQTDRWTDRKSDI